MPTIPRLLTAQQAAILCRVDPETIVAPQLTGARRLWDRHVLEALLGFEADHAGLARHLRIRGAIAPSSLPQYEVVYLIEALGLRLLKIGRTRQLRARLRQLSTKSPAPLRLVGYALGGFELETALHKRCAEERSHGEWFAINGETEALALDWMAERRARAAGFSVRPGDVLNDWSAAA